MAKAVALYSGGLDSTLALLILLKQGIDVVAVNFTTDFGCAPEDKSSCSSPNESMAAKFGFILKYYPLTEEFFNIVKKPRFGWGKNMNPCIDCRILMLKEAWKLSGLIKANFIITGEVLGQRPMSQHRETLKLIEREAGVEGLVLRPLSAQLLPKTIPEDKGWVDRDRLYAFSGRTRKPQIALAEEFGLTKIPQPASGCYLTVPQYSAKLKDLLAHNPECSLEEVLLLKLGRHFRLSDKTKLIVGRNEDENNKLERFTRYPRLTPPEDIPGPVALLISQEASEDELILAARICARYSNVKLTRVPISVAERIVPVEPLSEELINKMRV